MTNAKNQGNKKWEKEGGAGKKEEKKQSFKKEKSSSELRVSQEKEEKTVFSTDSSENSKEKQALSRRIFSSRKKKALYWIGSVLVFFVGLAMISLYLFPSLNKFSRPIFSLLPLPVALVDGKVITSKEVSENLEAVKNFYLNQDFSSLKMRVDFETPEGKERLKIREKEILDKMVEDKIIFSICAKHGIRVSSQEVQDELEKKIAESGAEKKSLELNLKALYGWDLEDFKNRIIISQLRLKKLFEHYQNKEKSKDEGFKKIIQAQKDLKEGKGFFETAKKYSEGESASSGGELGWFSYEMLIPQVAEKVFDLEKGEISDIIESPLGYHIVKVDDIRFVESANAKEGKEKQTSQKDASENSSAKGEDLKTIKEIKISQVFVKSGGFLEWLRKEKSQFKVLIFNREYLWDSKEGKVIFRDEKMNKRERELRLKGEGDPSL